MTVFAVRDNGRGIAADDIPRVFEPFRRVGRQDVPGEGMGLAYVHALVRRHGGDLTCQSTLGVGTTFTFTIAHTLPQEVSHA
jgi:signal transduction histidine kinase